MEKGIFPGMVRKWLMGKGLEGVRNAAFLRLPRGATAGKIAARRAPKKEQGDFGLRIERQRPTAGGAGTIAALPSRVKLRGKVAFCFLSLGVKKSGVPVATATRLGEWDAAILRQVPYPPAMPPFDGLRTVPSRSTMLTALSPSKGMVEGPGASVTGVCG